MICVILSQTSDKISRLIPHVTTVTSSIPRFSGQWEPYCYFTNCQLVCQRCLCLSLFGRNSTCQLKLSFENSRKHTCSQLSKCMHFVTLLTAASAPNSKLSCYKLISTKANCAVNLNFGVLIMKSNLLLVCVSFTIIGNYIT